MVIPLVEADEVRTGRGIARTKGEKYGKYMAAIERLVPWIKTQITDSKDGMIRVKAVEMGKEMGGEFSKRNPTSLYWGLKFALYHHGVVVDTGTHRDGDKLLVMRSGTEEDKLPPSLARYLEVEEPGETGEGEGIN